MVRRGFGSIVGVYFGSSLAAVEQLSHLFVRAIGTIARPCAFAESPDRWRMLKAPCEPYSDSTAGVFHLSTPIGTGDETRTD
jgi:hypothetical protein